MHDDSSPGTEELDEEAPVLLFDCRSPKVLATFEGKTAPHSCIMNFLDEKKEKHKQNTSKNFNMLCIQTSGCCCWCVCVRDYAEAHSDDVTQAKWSPTSPSVFMTGSTDGLVNVYDIVRTRNCTMELQYREPLAVRRTCKYSGAALAMFAVVLLLLLVSTHNALFLCNNDDVTHSHSHAYV